MPTVAETIKNVTRKHLIENNGVLLSQNVTAIGWIGGTVPDDIPDNKGIIELPTSDSSNSAIACGFALAGRRPIYVIRFQGFLHYNAASLTNYAAKSKELFNVPCPIFTRGLTVEGGIGPVASNSHHSMLMRMPGMPVFAPMTPFEWRYAWDYFIEHDDPVFCSEHRSGLNVDYEIGNIISTHAKLTVFAIGYSRVNALKLIKTINTPFNLINIFKLKPFEPADYEIQALKDSGKGLVIDSDFETCGASKSIAYDLMHKAHVPVHALGLEDRTAGFSVDNVTPSVEKIKQFVEDLSK